MANSDFIFKITPRESREEYSVTATSGTVLDEELCKKYPEDAIVRAKQLKAKHGTKYSDAYYLDMGKSIALQEIIGANREIHKRRIVDCPIKDMEWAGYSYEEILAMETEGYKIPEDVLQWAHAQQEADVTDYVMVSDATATEDNVTDATGTNNGELDNLKKKAQQNITKSDKALEEAAQDIEKYNEIADKAKKIKDKKEDNYKETMNEISSKTEEWKQLDDKKKTGKLSRSEEKRYKNLSKQLNGTDGSLMKELQVEHADLDEFLDTLNGLNNDITENLSLAQNTIKAGKELGAYEKSYNSDQLPLATSGIVMDGNGKSSDPLYEVKSNEEISELAIEKGSELNEVANNQLAEITNKENTELSEFANNYTELATETENKTENAMGEQFESNENSEKKQNEPIDFKVSTNISYQNSILATATTLVSTTDLLARDKGVNKNDKELQKELKLAQKDSAALSKESATTQTKLEKTQSQEDEFLAELESVQNKAETEEPQSTEADTKVAENNAQKQSLTSQITEKQDESKSLKDLVKKATVKSSESTSRGEKLTKALTSRNDNLETRNTNAEKVAQNTQLVGAGTVTKGFVDTAIGTGLQNVGATLMSNPFTFAEGAMLLSLGISLVQQGEKELAFGTIAMGTGSMGLMATKTATDTNKDANATIKDANQIFKTNNQEIKEAGEISGPEGQTTQTNEQNTTEQTGETPTEETTGNVTPTTGETTPTTEEQQPVQAQATPTSETEENQETQSTQANEQQQNKEPSVSMEFSSQNAVDATATSIKATADMVKDERDMNKLTRIVRSQTKQSENLIKNIDSETAKAATQHSANLAESESISRQHTTAQNEVQSAQTQEEAMAAQTKAAGLSTQLDAAATKDEQVTLIADKTVSSSVQKLAQFRANTQTMNKDLSALDKTRSDQFKIAAKTTAVGIGTTALGVADTNFGAGMMLSGLTLMTNPFTYSMGVAQVIAGEIVTLKGLGEMATGTVATATGTAGAIANAVTDAVARDSDTTLKLANAQNNELEKKAGESSKELEQEPETADETDSTNNVDIAKLPQNENENAEENEFLSEISQISASASANINAGESILTDDKADRKLSRFNTESIIESKKKMKKVQAVSASSGGKA